MHVSTLPPVNLVKDPCRYFSILIMTNQRRNFCECVCGFLAFWFYVLFCFLLIRTKSKINTLGRNLPWHILWKPTGFLHMHSSRPRAARDLNLECSGHNMYSLINQSSSGTSWEILATLESWPVFIIFQLGPKMF